MTCATRAPAAKPVADDYPPCLDAELGASASESGTRFRVWAPAAVSVTLRLFSKGTDEEDGRPLGRFPMMPGPDGTWELTFEDDRHGQYYDYLVEFGNGSVRRTADPWARAAGANGRRSMVVDLSRTDPEGWGDDRPPLIAPERLVVWETHIGDFSNDPRSGVPEAHRGGYLAFTHPDTSLDGGGRYPTCVAYLKRLGVTVVQLMPFYDFGSVDETRPGGYNWGYDPLNYNVPEGGYATDPYDGAVRIRECKAMIKALHDAGMLVVMDVVYNHMFSPDNWFERMTPGYFCRRKRNGALSNGSDCGCDMATEKPMFRRYMVDSVVYWAREYHVDGFRFDLMGLIDTDTMNAMREALDALPGGERILMYGEPWSARDTGAGPGVTLAQKNGLGDLDARIGWFCDRTRDAIKGHVFSPRAGGFVNGRARDEAGDVTAAADAWRGADAGGGPNRVVQYVSAHDDLTLWDKLCATMLTWEDGTPAPGAYDADGPDADRALAANRIAAGLVLTSAGLPFMLSGEEFARTKHGDDDSYDSGAEENRLDWARARRLDGMVRYYAALIGLRASDPVWAEGRREPLRVDGEVAAYRVGGYAVYANPTDRTIPVPAPGEGAWSCVLDSDGSPHPDVRPGGRLTLTPRSFTVWRGAGGRRD